MAIVLTVRSNDLNFYTIEQVYSSFFMVRIVYAKVAQRLAMTRGHLAVGSNGEMCLGKKLSVKNVN